MARRYLQSSYIREFCVAEHQGALPKLQLLMGHEMRICTLYLRDCNFNFGEGNALEKTLSGCAFEELLLQNCQIPGTVTNTRKEVTSVPSELSWNQSQN